MFDLNKKIDSFKFEKNYRLDNYKIFNNQMYFHYNEKITNRIKKYFEEGLIRELVDLDLITPSILKKTTQRIVLIEFFNPNLGTLFF